MNGSPPPRHEALLRALTQALGDTAVRCIEQVNFDQLSVHEDMAGRAGPLLGPKQVEEFIAPYYRRCWDAAQERGARLFVVAAANLAREQRQQCGIRALAK